MTSDRLHTYSRLKMLQKIMLDHAIYMLATEGPLPGFCNILSMLQYYVCRQSDVIVNGSVRKLIMLVLILWLRQLT